MDTVGHTRPLFLFLGGVLVDVVGIQAIFWAGAASLAVAGVLGIVKLVRSPVRAAAYR
jgi:hypothetical protein